MSDGAPPSTDSAVLECRGLSKSFRLGGERLEVLSDVDLRIERGQCVAIIGQSGAGKSTLLHLLGGLDQPTSGEVEADGQLLSNMGDAARGRLRNRLLGFVYQFHHLLPEFSALENVAMPLLIRGEPVRQALSRAEVVLGEVGLGQRLAHQPGELSGGERQRAAVARALVTGPGCVLADEPTGNLDRHNAEHVFNMMLELNRSMSTSLVMVTHDHQLANRMDAIWLLRDGRLARQ